MLYTKSVLLCKIESLHMLQQKWRGWIADQGCSQFGFFDARIWITFDFFGNQKDRQNFAFFSRKGLALAKHCLSCVFITNLFWRESMTMQGTENIVKILLLP